MRMITSTTRAMIVNGCDELTVTPTLVKRQEYERDKLILKQSKISKELLIDHLFNMEKRVKELEEVVMKQQNSVLIAEDVPLKIQIHQEEIERLKGENRRLQLENRKLKRGSGR